jgi:hypothetical protein
MPLYITIEKGYRKVPETNETRNDRLKTAKQGAYGKQLKIGKAEGRII